MQDAFSCGDTARRGHLGGGGRGRQWRQKTHGCACECCSENVTIWDRIVASLFTRVTVSLAITVEVKGCATVGAMRSRLNTEGSGWDASGWYGPGPEDRVHVCSGEVHTSEGMVDVNAREDAPVNGGLPVVEPGQDCVSQSPMNPKWTHDDELFQFKRRRLQERVSDSEHFDVRSGEDLQDDELGALSGRMCVFGYE